MYKDDDPWYAIYHLAVYYGAKNLDGYYTLEEFRQDFKSEISMHFTLDKIKKDPKIL